jgi:hypothetical protein
MQTQLQQVDYMAPDKLAAIAAGNKTYDHGE